MTRTRNLISVLLLCPLLNFAQTDTLATKRLSSQQMQQDFTYLRKILTETHPALYRYSSKDFMTQKMDSLYALLNKPMAFYDFYLMLSDLIANVRCAHTYITPTKKLESFYLNQIKTFPILIFFMENKYYVTVNGSKDTSVKPGDELLAINGIPVTNIRTQMQKLLWADGYNEMGKSKALDEAYFSMFYYLLIERPTEFKLTLKNQQGKEFQVALLAQTFRTTINNYKQNSVNKEILQSANQKNKLDRKKGWRLTIREGEKIGVMRINAFGGGKSEEEARKKMRDFLDNCMRQLKEKQVQDLIIDLRYNGGGWDIQGVELFTYLIDQPTRCYQRLHAITDSSEFLKLSDISAEDQKLIRMRLQKESDGTFSVREEFSDQLRLQQPKPNRFVGNVYILANRGSGSTTSEFLAYTKSNKRAVIIGEECNGAYEGGNGGSFLHFDLPHAKISFGTPLIYYNNAVTPLEQKGRGTLPDYQVDYKIEDLLQGKDTQLNFALELIRKVKDKK
jgi:C-terminal processing protease CtpA/Prc